MDKRPTKQPEGHSWAVYHIRGTPAQFVGLVYDAPDEQAAIAKAIEQSACKLSNPGYNTSRLVSLNENLMDACRPPPMCESRGDTG